MLTYNTQLKSLILPEYGRNIQRMVDHCVTIEDSDERSRCARAIIKAMAILFPAARDAQDYEHTLWNHLAIMSDFRLDVDSPYEFVRPDELTTTPEPVFTDNEPIRFRHYGKCLERMVATAASMPESEERQALILLLANQMKKQMLAVNPDGVEDARVFKDLAFLSHGSIRLDPAVHHLHEFKEAPQPATGKKKRKRK